ncbi:hypothetical protein [Caenispirillum bisanense]|uniref:hypothetical protein n=1 Tax=Caenispirillum bisanense TaxID=414052 RepID=UPI0031D4241C
MAFNPLTEKGIPLDRQLRHWAELNVEPYRKEDVHPYTRTRVIAMNGVEVEAAMFSHNMARHTVDTGLKKVLAQVRRIEQQQQKVCNWLIPGEENSIENTVGYEQVAVDLTSWVARNEPDPYLKQVYEFGLLEDFDHLYRYSNLLDLMGGDPAAIVGGYTEITPGRPTIFEHRHPSDELRRPMTIHAADFQSVMNAMTILAAEQQTMNYYMNIGNRPTDPIARGLYLEIAQIEEQHVTHYESIMDPTMGWHMHHVLHEYNECWMYWSFMEDETDARIRAIWELHLSMELEHLRLACEAMKAIEGRDPADFLPANGMPRGVQFHENKDYVRGVLAAQSDLTAWDSEFLPIDQLPKDHRYFDYQAAVNASVPPTEQIIARHREERGEDYRLETEGPNPVPALRRKGNGSTMAYHDRVQMNTEEPRAGGRM